MEKLGFGIQNQMSKFYSQSKSSKPNFYTTGSTNSNAGGNRTSQLFGRMRRNDKRLNSTIQFQHPAKSDGKSKFQKMKDTMGRSFSWTKWKMNSFPVVSQTFKKNLALRIEKQNKQNMRKEDVGADELKLRHRIREVIKLKQDIQKAQHNNKLIRLIEDFHENKINSFFDQLEKHLHSND